MESAMYLLLMMKSTTYLCRVKNTCSCTKSNSNKYHPAVPSTSPSLHHLGPRWKFVLPSDLKLCLGS
eukprot:1847505-Lingulodinium_polyedra.AAC.1